MTKVHCTLLPLRILAKKLRNGVVGAPVVNDKVLEKVVVGRRRAHERVVTTMRRKSRTSTPTIALAHAQVSHLLSRRLPYYLTVDEAHKLIEATGNGRDRLLLRVLGETGVRVSEAIALQLGDLGRDGIRVLGKGQAERVVFVQESLVASLLFFAQERSLARVDFFFSSRKGGHITKQRADQIIKEVSHQAGLQRNVHAHLFRHGYAINFLNCGGRLDALQEQLGHRDINTTRIYLRLTDEDVKREVDKVLF